MLMRTSQKFQTACEKPENHGLPITQWSHSTLTAEIIKQGSCKRLLEEVAGSGTRLILLLYNSK